MSESYGAMIDAWKQLAESGDFESAYRALEEVVGMLETGGLSLSIMTDCYEVGLRLSNRCTDLLRNAELRVSALEQSLSPIAEAQSLNPFDFEE